jgi:hypothetical protein
MHNVGKLLPKDLFLMHPSFSNLRMNVQESGKPVLDLEENVSISLPT